MSYTEITANSSQTFKSSESEWKTAYMAYSSELMKDIEPQFRSIKLDATSANEAIANANVGISQFDVPLTYVEISQFGHRRGRLENFTKGVHQDAVDQIDDPFKTAMAACLSEINANGEKTINVDSESFQKDIEDILGGVSGTNIAANFTEATLKLLKNGPLPKSVVDTLISLVKSETGNPTGLKYYLINGIRFTVTGDGSKFKIVSVYSAGKRTDKICEAFMEALTGENWKARTMRKAMNDGIPVSNLTRTENSLFKAVIDMADVRAGGWKSIAKNAGKTGLDTFKNGINPFNDFKTLKSVESTKLGKVSAGLGIASNVITVGTDFVDNCRDENGNWNFTAATIQKTVTDSLVDIAAGAGAEAVGAAVGSCFLPPLGTAVGFAVGAAVNYAMNKDMDGDGKSLVDNVKDGVDSIWDNTIGGLFGGAFA